MGDDRVLSVLAQNVCREKQVETLLEAMGHVSAQRSFLGRVITVTVLAAARWALPMHLRVRPCLHRQDTRRELFNEDPQPASRLCQWLGGVYTPRLLFGTVLSQLTGSMDSCDNLCDFTRRLAEGLAEASPAYIVVDQAERLRGLGLLGALLRLRELCGRPLCCLLLSRAPWEKFRGSGGTEPFRVHFPQYSATELSRLLGGQSLLPAVLGGTTLSLRELQHAAAAVGAPTDGEEPKTPSWRKEMAAKLRQGLQSVYIRETSGSQQALRMELPFHARFLLLAAYLASYNPPGTDRKFFVKARTSNTKRQKKASQLLSQHLLGPKQFPLNRLVAIFHAIVDEQVAPSAVTLSQGSHPLSQHLLGPKQFPLNRLVAIFHAIVDEQVAPSAVTLSQVESLVSLRLLARVSREEQLSTPRYKCLVGLDCIRAVAK
ncbi:hypothetical protein HPB48_013084 [Haemaphysalis longicornis]|uniref:Origin recognition complex subunit 5 C-terminal domain-containing protein n=1 Tax=Haemaphysalis longicornis TaxID=44386 RepID=A0A9J6G3S4_HAELO|nr:hypothetical protein HPB48_013084 [Haemaphysalis longicornis]